MGKAVKVGLYVGGVIVLLFGLLFMAYGLFGVPQFIGWGVMMFALFVILIGVGMLYLGHRQKSTVTVGRSQDINDNKASPV